MPSENSRIEVVKELGESIPPIYISRKAKHAAEKNYQEALAAYDQARKILLPYEYALYFRILIFGSARIEADTTEYKKIVEITKRLAEEIDTDIVTGGGDGLMCAANEGLSEAVKDSKNKNGKNIGVNIELPFEQEGNGFLHYSSSHADFTTRIQEMVDKTHGAYAAKGGIGTLLEQLMITQLKQVGHLEKGYPIVADPIWKKVADKWNDELYHNRDREDLKPLIDEKDLNLIQFSDNTDEIVEIFKKSYEDWYENVRKKVRFRN